MYRIVEKTGEIKGKGEEIIIKKEKIYIQLSMFYLLYKPEIYYNYFKLNDKLLIYFFKFMNFYNNSNLIFK